MTEPNGEWLRIYDTNALMWVDEDNSYQLKTGEGLEDHPWWVEKGFNDPICTISNWEWATMRRPRRSRDAVHQRQAHQLGFDH